MKILGGLGFAMAAARLLENAPFALPHPGLESRAPARKTAPRVYGITADGRLITGLARQLDRARRGVRGYRPHAWKP